MLSKINIPFPKFAVAQTAEEAIKISKDLNFPILVRPSYVLGGQGMKIVINEDELEHHIIELLKDIPGNRVLLDHYHLNQMLVIQHMNHRSEFHMVQYVPLSQ